MVYKSIYQKYLAQVVARNLIMKKLAIKIFFILLVFFYIYNPPIYFLPMNSGVMLGGMFFVLYLIKFILKILLKKTVSFDKSFINLIFLISLLVFYCLFVSIVTTSFDLQLFKSSFSFLLFFIPGGIGITDLAKKIYSKKEILKIFIIVTVIQSIIILSMLVNPGIKDFLFSLLRDGSARLEKNLLSGGFRYLGFAFNSTWDLSIVQSMAIMYLAVLFKLDNKEINLKNTAFFILIAISIFLTGRTGFLGLLLALAIIVIPSNINEIPLRKMLRFSVRIMIVILPVLFLLKSILPVTVIDMVEKDVIPWAFEIFQSNNGGKVETASSNELKSMYFWPSSKTLLVGDGYYVSPYDSTRYYMDTDAGYMRHILFYGIIGLLILLIVYANIFYKIYINFTGVSNSFSIKVFIVFLAFYFYISHIKGDLLLGADMPIKSLFLLYFIFRDDKEILAFDQKKV